MNELIVAETKTDAAVPRLLTALGAVFRLKPLEDVMASGVHGGKEPRSLILAEEHLIAAAKRGGSPGGNLRAFLSSYRHVLVFPFAATAEGLEALGELAETRIDAAKLTSDDSDYIVHGSREMCGPFSGLRFGPRNRTGDSALTVAATKTDIEFVVSIGGAGLFTRFKLGPSEVFVNSCAGAFDVRGEYCRNLRAAECFSGLVPLIFFLRHAQISLPQVARHWANWIIDDPNLTPNYGFLNSRDLAECVGRIGAAVTIGFIPWNHRRTAAEVVNLFRIRWPRLSICVHGCDHTRSEFSTKTVVEALALASLATSRMQHLEHATSLAYERVMVFPQGKFSRSAMHALRQTEFLGAVNTELIDARTGEGVPAGELLQPAITSYGGLPLFMRRPPEEPIANFALDLLLGKPCLIVTHHDYFKSGLHPFRLMVESLNRLEPTMAWTNLETGISSTYLVEKKPNGAMTVRLFGSRTRFRLDNTVEEVFFSKTEAFPNLGFEVRRNGQLLSYRRTPAELTFTAPSLDGKLSTIEVRLAPPAAQPIPRQTMKYRAKVLLRRYLSEVRDNSVARSPRIERGIKWARSMINRSDQTGAA